MVQAGLYSAVTHYLKAVKAAGTDDADAGHRQDEGHPGERLLRARASSAPTACFRHDMYLVQVKTPAESKYPWDYYKIVKTHPGRRGLPLGRGRRPARWS